MNYELLTLQVPSGQLTRNLCHYRYWNHSSGISPRILLMKIFPNYKSKYLKKRKAISIIAWMDGGKSKKFASVNFYYKKKKIPKLIKIHISQWFDHHSKRHQSSSEIWDKTAEGHSLLCRWCSITGNVANSNEYFSECNLISIPSHSRLCYRMLVEAPITLLLIGVDLLKHNTPFIMMIDNYNFCIATKIQSTRSFYAAQQPIVNNVHSN